MSQVGRAAPLRQRSAPYRDRDRDRDPEPNGAEVAAKPAAVAGMASPNQHHGSSNSSRRRLRRYSRS
ncbi:hypothetical protein VTJ04DRAFT_8824 [Mycothermus thermophilus]|uniref:uncharacterized protein n=1 Tax=Humicola insolens TaxID=85995 RepID=UPI003744775B